MANLQQVTESIGTLLASGDLTKSMRMEHLARELVEVSQPVLDRLRRCEDYLQKGLRSEALQLAKCEPDLLDSIAQLDFPERETWDETLALYGLPVGPKPSQESAAAINQAYADEEPLLPLLKKHRFLALARAPYMDRMNVLREMIQIEPSNIAFQEDLGKFETWRIGTIRSELAEGKSKQDHNKIIALLEEVEKTPWVTTLPDAILREIRSLGQQAKRSTYYQKATRLSSDAVEAASYRNETKCRQLVQEFEREVANLGLTSSDTLVHGIQPVYKWLKIMEERRGKEFAKEVACGELEEMLHNPGQKPEDIIKKCNEIEALGEVPKHLDDKSQLVLDSIHRSKKLREYLILGCVFALGSFLLIGFVVFIVTRSR